MGDFQTAPLPQPLSTSDLTLLSHAQSINKAGPALAPCTPLKMADDLHIEDKTVAPVSEDRVQQSSALVEIDGVMKSFGGKIALKSVSFSVPSSQTCGLLGPNGAGKTTLFRLLMGILKATEGKLLVDGRDAFQERVEVKRLIGFLPDEPVFYSYLSGREVLERGWPGTCAQPWIDLRR